MGGRRKKIEAIVYQCQHCNTTFQQQDCIKTYDSATNSVLCPGCGSGLMVNELESIYCKNY